MKTDWVERLKLRQLRVILAIEERGSISRAAEDMFVTQAAISKMVGEVEQLAGVQLFERRGRGVVSTLAGQQVIQAARRILGELKILGDEVALVAEGGAGLLRIGAQALSISPVISRIFAAMKVQYPRVTLQLYEETLPEVLKALRTGRVDLAFGRMVPRLMASDLEGMAIPSPHYVVVASAGHPLLQRARISWVEAMECLWCLPLPGTPTRNHFADFLSELRLPFPQMRVEIGSLPYLTAFLQATPALSLVTQNHAESWREQGLCQILPLPLTLAIEPIGLIWPANTPLSPSARLFQKETVNLVAHLQG
ncbi:LysR family transcriptional regulator [Allorhizobium undicola]|uniref:LysR family transcriptional regulator n=1 Tax=Allorhizobium undicola TaxID=78527 RepID=UPI000487C9C0|nr:LysR family transcriptional regulator [Allorhizobium undicola]